MAVPQVKRGDVAAPTDSSRRLDEIATQDSIRAARLVETGLKVLDRSYE